MAHAGRPIPGITYDWRPAFLLALRHVPVIAQAAKIADVHRATVDLARRNDPVFAEEFNAAMEDGIDAAEREAFRRGVEGFCEPVIHQGQLQFTYERYEDEEGKEQFRKVLDAQGQPIPLTIRKHSDALLQFWLKGRRKTFATERTELTGADGGPVGMQDEGARAARAAQLLALAHRRMEDGKTPPADEEASPSASTNLDDLV